MQEEGRSQIEGALQQVVEQLNQILKRGVREQTQEENHTTFFIAGNNEVGTDSMSPSAYWISGYHLLNSKISTFHGEEVPHKNGVPSEQWLFEVRSVQGFYSVIKRNYNQLVRCGGIEIVGIISKLGTV